MYEQAASNWAVRLYSLFDPTNFLPLFPNVWNKRVLGSSRYPDDTKVRDTDILVGYLILFWIMLYLLYEKCLNSLFRRMRFPLIQRSRIIKATWYCGFCFGSICYMRSLATQILSFAAHKQGMMYQELGVALHKSFYLHQAGIDILCHGAWIKGCANLLFASFILNPYQQNYRRCMVTGIFLMYKTIDVVMVNVCRILLCILQTILRPICKLLFLLHCLIWIYLYLYYVPVFMLWSEEANYTGVEPGLWLWFAIECLDSVLLRLIGHAKATHWLEICLFPPPSQEAIELAGIHKRHRESLKKSNERTAKKVELWQTLICAMAIKKKIKRIRQTRNNIDSSSLDNSEEMELLETHVGDEMPEKELEGNYT
ncbi:hypothetical protein DMN91_003578 [Ooceraea biroi]|uniref:Transmembrane protein n=1 Tax=Ooceraea biroi TaxID=2015173 RepID=A0A3L8DSI8_OOCBI|nr:uncharacterized protein LOC105286830 isoform X2 [Ooceraea biroi]RLU23374.1 hypothetical protein DMN91_003578 [Ooceraea biroi]